MHYTLEYAVGGLAVGVLIATIDLVTPEKPPLGFWMTLASMAVWPVFLVLAVLVAIRHASKEL